MRGRGRGGRGERERARSMQNGAAGDERGGGLIAHYHASIRNGE